MASPTLIHAIKNNDTITNGELIRLYEQEYQEAIEPRYGKSSSHGGGVRYDLNSRTRQPHIEALCIIAALLQDKERFNKVVKFKTFLEFEHIMAQREAGFSRDETGGYMSEETCTRWLCNLSIGYLGENCNVEDACWQRCIAVLNEWKPAEE